MKEYMPKIKNISHDRIKLSLDFLNFKKLENLADLDSIIFYDSQSPYYSRSALVSLGHSKLRILRDPVQPYLPPLQLDSHAVIDDESRQGFLVDLLGDDLSVGLSYLEIAIDFAKDDFFEEFIHKNFLMKYNKKGSNKHETTQYFGERKASCKQIRIYPREGHYSPSDVFYRLEVFFKSKYLSRHCLSLASLATHDFSKNLINSISFKKLNLEYLKKKVSPAFSNTLQNMPLAGAVTFLKQRQIDLRYALQQHPYQDTFNAAIKKHWEYILSPVPEHDPSILIEDFFFV